MTETAMARVERSESYIVGVDDAISPARLIEQVALIQNVMKSVMKDGEHFGKIPGCGEKPSLLKPGAEKLCFTFRLDPEFDIEVIDMGKGHREYRVKCTLYSINGGNRVGSGVGSASTMEGKWRYRTGPVEFTGNPVPKAYWDNAKTDFKKALEAIGGKGFSAKKNPDTNKWEIAIQGEKVEHDNPADMYNTVLKMGKKRAMVDAVLTCTAASDIFTQDVEELVDNGVITVSTNVEKPKTNEKIIDPPAPAVSAPEVAVEVVEPVVANPVAPPPVAAVEKPSPAPPSTEKKDDATLRHELQELAAIAVDAGHFQTEAQAIYFATAYTTKDGKEAGYKDVVKLKGWKMSKAIAKLSAKLDEKPSTLDEERNDDIKF